jgi:hypothetical protein
VFERMGFLYINRRCLVALTLFAASINAFVHVAQPSMHRQGKLFATPTTSDSPCDRRSLLAAGVAMATLLTSTQAALAEQAVETRQGIEVNAFNGLIFNYRGGAFGGLDASTLNEPSISYSEFNQKLKAGEVEFVEFLAPDGDAAYATFKTAGGGSKAAPIRIGEGYPIEQHDGYSSPAFCVRAVKNAGVPYKFTVPALRKFQNS